MSSQNKEPRRCRSQANPLLACVRLRGSDIYIQEWSNRGLVIRYYLCYLRKCFVFQSCLCLLCDHFPSGPEGFEWKNFKEGLLYRPEKTTVLFLHSRP